MFDKEFDKSRTIITLARAAMKKSKGKLTRTDKVELEVLYKLEFLYPQFIGDGDRMMEMWVWRNQSLKVS